MSAAADGFSPKSPEVAGYDLGCLATDAADIKEESLRNIQYDLCGAFASAVSLYEQMGTSEFCSWSEYVFGNGLGRLRRYDFMQNREEAKQHEHTSIVIVDVADMVLVREVCSSGGPHHEQIVKSYVFSKHPQVSLKIEYGGKWWNEERAGVRDKQSDEPNVRFDAFIDEFCSDSLFNIRSCMSLVDRARKDLEYRSLTA